jgi:predicted TPR repeat methyltransferase
MKKKYLKEAHISNKRESVESLYNDWSSTYDKEITENNYATPDRVALILKKLISNKKEKILDYGCGTGLSGVALLKAGFDNVDGADPSEKMLKEAKKKRVYGSIIKLNLDTPTPIRLGHYSIITAVGVMGPGAASINLFDEIMSLLGPGGIFIFSFNDKALMVPEYLIKLNGYLSTNRAELLFKEYGPHLPGINLKCMIYAIKKNDFQN